MANQTPEQIARDNIDSQLIEAGWLVQSRDEVDLNAGPGVAVREYQTDIGPADYVLFVDCKPVGVIEAKREEEGERLTTVEYQSSGYAKARLKYNLNKEPLPFVFESTGELTYFTDYRDPRPRARVVFSFYRPETLAEWSGQEQTLRGRLQALPTLDKAGLRSAQFKAITKLEKSFKKNRPRSLIQMATGAGKTFAACTFAYRLLKHADAKRILFLVDTRNLGEQAEQEFLKFQPNDDNRKFTEHSICLLKLQSREGIKAMNIHDMIKKKPSNPNMTEFSSSEETVPLTEWKDVLELGLHLIRELKLDQRDTIDRWMVFHLAELIDASENGKTEDERKEARKIAAETILKIWDRRSSLPGNAYPLARYKEILTVLDLLRPDDNPFIYPDYHTDLNTDIKREKIVSSISNELSHLSITLLLMRLPPEGEFKETDLAVVDALNEEEQKIYKMLRELNHWTDLLTLASDNPDYTNAEDGKLSKEELLRFALKRVDTISEKLGDLRQELKQDAIS